MTTQDRIARLTESRVAALTAYDYPTARLLDEAGVDVILVGDSLGMVFAGNRDTTSVTMEQMIYHTTVVRRGVSQALLVSDLPYHSYDSVREAVANSRRLIAAGAEAVKMEGGVAIIEKVKAVLAAGIPTMGHVGMLPQSVHREGRYKKKGKTEQEATALVEDARALEAAGVFAIVLESIVPEVATEITQSIRIPTIGIGAGAGCTGQISVVHDLAGFYPWFTPPFARPKANFAELLSAAAKAYTAEVKSGL
jgi:3-methyl-2-oxobutanoate hydroxymethyltransferase